MNTIRKAYENSHEHANFAHKILLNDGNVFGNRKKNMVPGRDSNSHDMLSHFAFKSIAPLKGGWSPRSGRGDGAFALAAVALESVQSTPPKNILYFTCPFSLPFPLSCQTHSLNTRTHVKN